MNSTGKMEPREPIGRGLRKLTPGLLAAEALAREVDPDEARTTTRVQWREAVTTLMRAGELQPAAANLMMTLIGFCGTWESEGVAIVFASNERLADELGYSQTRSIRALMAQLSSGPRPLLCHKERPGGRRGVEFDPLTGEKTYYGVSLTPLIAQLDHIASIAEELNAAYAERRKLKSAIMAALKRLEALVSAAIDAGLNQDEWWARLDMVSEIADSLRDETVVAVLAEWREVTMGAVEDAERALTGVDREPSDANTDMEARSTADSDADHRQQLLIDSEKDSSYEESDGPPITINKTSTDKSEHCTARGIWRRAKPGIPLRSANAEQNGLENKPAVGGTQQTHAAVGRDQAMKTIIETDLAKKKITPEIMVALSEELYAFLPFDAVEDPGWGDLAVSADQARVAIGLSEPAWRHTVASLGVMGALAALTFATAARNISNPAGYVRKIADLAADGRFVDLGDKLRKLHREKAADPKSGSSTGF